MGGSSTQKLSSLAKKQESILGQSWDMYLNTIYPEAVNMMARPTSMKDELLSSSMKNVNAAYDTAKKTSYASLAKRGLMGGGNGVEGAVDTMLEGQRANTLSQAYTNVLMQDFSQMQNQRMNALSMLMGKSPTPTQAAPVLTEQNQGFASAFGAVTGGLGGLIGSFTGGNGSK